MKLVHTGDWHVGKTLRGRQRSSEQREILEELKTFLHQENVDILLIAGDIFDTFTPSAEAEDIVYNFFHDISQLRISTIVIAGNHDSDRRCEAIANLLSVAGITMVGSCSLTQPKEIFVTVRDGTRVHIIPIPFIPERTFVRAEDLTASESTGNTAVYSQETGKLLRQIAQNFAPGTVHIVVAHLLMHGARPGGGERLLYLGDNYAVHPEEIPGNIHYVALGHIHRYQKIEAASPVYYCGSALQLDFSERDMPKGFLCVEGGAGSQFEPRFIEFQHGKKLVRLAGTWPEIQAALEENPALAQAYLQIIICGEDAANTGIFHYLKKEFPNVVDMRREYTPSEDRDLLPREADWLPKLYQEYYKQQHERDLPPATLSEFIRIYQQCDATST